MKNLYLILCASFISFFSACDKEDSIDTKNLTQCPDNADCNYYFKTNASNKLRGQKPVEGDSTIFVYEQKTKISTAYLLIRAAKNISSFRLQKSEIASGHVNNVFICPSCDFITLKPVDGYVEGKKTSGTKWYIDAKVILAASYNAQIRDTIEVRQIFTRKKSN